MLKGRCQPPQTEHVWASPCTPQNCPPLSAPAADTLSCCILLCTRLEIIKAMRSFFFLSTPDYGGSRLSPGAKSEDFKICFVVHREAFSICFVLTLMLLPRSWRNRKSSRCCCSLQDRVVAFDWVMAIVFPPFFSSVSADLCFWITSSVIFGVFLVRIVTSSEREQSPPPPFN